jgi:hypothetical protein
MTMMKMTMLSCASLCFATTALAQQTDVEPNPNASVSRVAEVGGLSPLLLNAALVADRGLAMSDGGYDTARSGALFDSAVEARIWGPVALRAVVTYSDDTRRMRPALGARVQCLRQVAHGIDGSLSSSFKTEGFDETEGEIETTVAIGRRFGSSYMLANVTYGQDPEGNERDGELRASWYHNQGRLVWGAEARVRSAIGQQHGTHSDVEPTFDAIGGPIAMASVGAFVLFAEVGPSAVKLRGADARLGLASLGGVGTAF